MKFTTSPAVLAMQKGHVGGDLLWLLASSSWAVSRARTSREKGPFCYELESILTFTDVLYIAHLWRLEFWWSFKGHRGFWILTPSSAAQSSASIVRDHLSSLQPWSLLLPPYCASVLHSPNYLSPRLNDTDLAIHSQISCCFNTAPELFGASVLEKQGHYNTLVRME